MNRLFKLTVLSLLSLTMLVGCAGETETTQPTEDETTAPTTATDSVETEEKKDLPPEEQPAGKGDAVFINGTKGNDNNNGKTPEYAVATFKKAFELLTDDCSRIVIVKTPKKIDGYNTPDYDGHLVLTSVYDGVDYAELNGAKLNISNCFSFNCDVTLENLNITSMSPDSRLCFNFHNVTIGENVNPNNSASRAVTLVAGYNVTDIALNATGHMTAAGVSHKGDCAITVNSGTWNAIVGGNYRLGYNSPMGTFDGNMTVNIGGDAAFVSGAMADDIEGLGVAAAGHNISKGTVTLNITGGTFKCPVYGIGKVGRYFNFTNDNGKNGTDGTQFGRDVRYEADVTVNISGGDFTDGSVVRVLQAPGDTALHGNYTLSVTGGSFSDDFEFSGFGIIGESSASGIDSNKAVAFDSINSKNTGAKTPLRIACCGDSITFGTCAAETTVNGYKYAKENFFYPNQMQKLYGTDAVVGNFGYPGSYVGTSHNKYLESCVYASLAEFEPDVIVLALGTNNASLMPTHKDAFIKNYRIMLEDMHERFPDAKIIMTTALYRWDKTERTEMVDQHIIPAQKQLASEYSYVTLYDTNTEYKPYGTTEYYKDKLHPNNAGYVKLAEVMKKGVDKVVR